MKRRTSCRIRLLPWHPFRSALAPLPGAQREVRVPQLRVRCALAPLGMTGHLVGACTSAAPPPTSPHPRPRLSRDHPATELEHVPVTFRLFRIEADISPGRVRRHGIVELAKAS